MSRWLVSLLLPLAISMSFAQYWDIEAVDSVSPDRDVFLRHAPDGRIMLCYQRPDTSVTVAWRDSIWHRERVPITGLLSSYEVGSRGEQAVCAGVITEIVELAVRNESTWLLETLRFRPNPWAAACSFDTAGRPMLTFGYASAQYEVDLLFLQKSDTGWQEQGFFPYFGPVRLLTDKRGRPIMHNWWYFQFPMSGQPWSGCYEDVWVRDQDTWYEVRRLSAPNGWMAATSAALDTGQVPHLAGYVWYYTSRRDSGFFLDDTRLDDRMSASALAYDHLDRPQLACRLDSSIEHRYLDSNGWHRTPVPGEFGGPVDVLLDTNDQPIILAQNAGMLYLIRGQDVVGLDAGPVTAHSRTPATLIVRRGVPFRCRYTGRLTDITGRTALFLRPGQNAALNLSPGIYHLVANDQAPTRVLLLP